MKGNTKQTNPRTAVTPPLPGRPPLLSPPSRALAIQGKCVFPTLELSSRVCPAGVLPRGERGDGLEVTSTHTPLRHVTSSPPVALALLACSSGPGEQKAKPSCSTSVPREHRDFFLFCQVVYYTWVLKASLTHLLRIMIIIMNYDHFMVLVTCNYGDVDEVQR